MFNVCVFLVFKCAGFSGKFLYAVILYGTFLKIVIFKLYLVDLIF